MSVFHVPSVCANANARAVDALERLCEHIDTFRTRPLVGEDFERVERELHEWFVEAEREVLGELLESLDVDVPSVAYLASSTIGVPVLGLRAARAGRKCSEKLPKPRISMRPPAARHAVICSSITLTASSTSRTAIRDCPSVMR